MESVQPLDTFSPAPPYMTRTQQSPASSRRGGRGQAGGRGMGRWAWSDELRERRVEVLKADVEMTELGTFFRCRRPTASHQSKPTSRPHTVNRPHTVRPHTDQQQTIRANLRPDHTPSDHTPHTHRLSTTSRDVVVLLTSHSW